MTDKTEADVSQIEDDIDMYEHSESKAPTLPPKGKVKTKYQDEDEDRKGNVEDESLLAGQYRGTPERSVPARNKRKNHNQSPKSPAMHEVITIEFLKA